MVAVRAGRPGCRPIAAVQSYLTDVLAHRPDEQAVLGFTPTEIEIDTADRLDATDGPDNTGDLPTCRLGHRGRRGRVTP